MSGIFYPGKHTYSCMNEPICMRINIFIHKQVFLSWKCLPSWSIYAHGRKLNVKIKLNVKSARQPINLAYILLSFLDRHNSSFPFFFKIKHQETTYTVRFFFSPSPYHRNEFCKCSKLQLKSLKTAGAQHSLEADLLKNCSQKFACLSPSVHKANLTYLSLSPYQCTLQMLRLLFC